MICSLKPWSLIWKVEFVVCFRVVIFIESFDFHFVNLKESSIALISYIWIRTCFNLFMQFTLRLWVAQALGRKEYRILVIYLLIVIYAAVLFRINALVIGQSVILRQVLYVVRCSYVLGTHSCDAVTYGILHLGLWRSPGALRDDGVLFSKDSRLVFVCLFFLGILNLFLICIRVSELWGNLFKLIAN